MKYNGNSGGSVSMGEKYKKLDNSDIQDNRYEEYLNLAGSMILALNMEGFVTYINNKGCEILGYKENDIIGKQWITNFIPPVSHEEIESIRQAVMKLKPGERDYEEGKIITSDGKYRWISWSNSGLFDEKGNLIGTLSSGEDITEKKENELKLIENENRLKDSEAMSHTGHWVRDLKSGEYVFSDEMYKIFGLDRRIKLISAELLHQLFHKDDATRIIEYTEKMLNEGKDYKFDGRLQLPDGNVKYVRASVRINKDAEENPVSASGVMTDVTNTALFEQELIRNELQLKKAEEIAKVGSFIQDLETDEYLCSDGFCRICGFSSLEGKVDFKKAIGVTHPDDVEYITGIIRESQKTGSDYEFENRIIRPDGEIRYVRSRGTYIKNKKGKPIKSMGTLLDITEYKENENSLLESQRRLKMAEEIAHIGHWERDYETGVSFWSDEVYRIIGREPQSFVASEKEYVKFIHPEDYEKFTEDSIKATSGEIPYDIKSRIIDANGNVKYIQIVGNRILEKGKLHKTFGTIEDTTPEKLYEEELLKKTKTLENAESIAHIGHWERDFKDDSMYWSDEIYRIIGFNPGDFEVYPNKDREFIHPDDWDELQEFYLKTRNEGTPFEIDVRAYKRTGEEVILKIKGGVTREESEGLIISGTIEDITELKKHYDEIEYMNYHDPLTGLFNRRYFDEKFTKIDSNENYPISVIIADVNGLKMINDTLGHNAGDEILKKTAGILDRAADEGDILARIGGDDFALLLPRTIKSQAELVINEVHNLFVEQEEDMGVSISMGLALKFDSFQRKEDVIKEAEDNMYTNKLYEKSSKRGDLLRLIMDALYERSSREELHSERVSKYCSDLGKRLKLPKHKINELSALGLLHDIGKIAVRDSVLNKPGTLDDEEWDEIKRHPETGYRILNKAPGMQEASKYILSHHERWDGNGYPEGLSTYDIPLQARIIAIADAFDAMRSKRPYRDPLPIDIAVSEMKKGAGSQFDPELAKVFVIEVLGKEW
jgi:diguanylate cyclase (GGDEF)-like protein/PAS domain S-box-containing protein